MFPRFQGSRGSPPHPPSAQTRLPRTLPWKHDLLIDPWDFIITPTCGSLMFDAFFSDAFLRALIASAHYLDCVVS